MKSHFAVWGLSFALCVATAGEALGKKPSAAQALRLAPIQDDVDYDSPAGDAVDQCTVEAESFAGKKCWVVRDGNEQILRRFLDSNGDNVVDRWSYFKDGLEVYRDIDQNYNGKADQCRWYHLGGMRWGQDADEDGRIDSWRIISAEEVAAEVVAALRSGDGERFARLLITPEEMEQVGLSDEQAKQINAKVSAAKQRFDDLARQQNVVDRQSKFVSFASGRPGIVPAGSNGSRKDLVVYENAAALVESGDGHQQVFLGTMIRVGNLWRIIDTPHVDTGTQAGDHGFFFRASLTTHRDAQAPAGGGISPEVQQAMEELETIERQLATAAADEQARLNDRRADILERLGFSASSREMRRQWIRQTADTVSAAVQTGTYPGGIERLTKLEKRLSDEEADAELIPYVTFRRLSAEYGQKLSDPKADFAKIQEDWLKDLQGFVERFPKSEDAAEAMLQLAIAQEFAGEDEDAIKWYSRITGDFDDTPAAKKASGAKRRLESVGKQIEIAGTQLDGNTASLGKLRGKLVLVHYWATWCEPCKADMQQIKELYAKHAGDGFAVLGVNLDHSREDMAGYLAENRFPWQHVYEEGGLESRLANEMGILTLPTMLLIDKDGTVINRGIHVAELETELKKRLED